MAATKTASKKSSSKANKVSSRLAGPISTGTISSLDDIEWASPAIKEAYMRSIKNIEEPL